MSTEEMTTTKATSAGKLTRSWDERVKLAAARKERKAAKRKERYEADPAYKEQVKALSKLHRDERKAAKAADKMVREKTDAPSTR